MAYIGKIPTVGNFQICDAISVVNGQAAYTLQVGGANVIPQSANHMIVSLNGIIQKPGSSFTVSGSTMTFASNLATGDSIDFVQILGNVLDVGAPSDGTVTSAKLASQDITFSEDIILGDSKKAIFGAGSDLQIYHDGSNSYVDDAGTGRLYLRGDNRVQIQKYTGEDMVTAIADGAVNLYYDNSKKLETTSSGINITGGVRLGGNNAANELDDYEEGTWTPSFSGTSGSPSGVNYASRNAYYTKVGNLVTASCWLNLLNWSSGPSGGAQINGLPFAGKNSTNYYGSGSVGFSALFDSDNAPRGAYVEGNTSVIRLKKTNSTSSLDNVETNVSASAMDGDEDIMVTVTYATDS